jgi:hypothetical protein
MNLPGGTYYVVNWKTFVTGSLTLLAYVTLNVLGPWWNGQPIDLTPLTNTDVILLVSALGQFLMGLSGRDADKSSQDSGVRPPVKAEAVADSTADAAIDQATR